MVVKGLRICMRIYGRLVSCGTGGRREGRIGKLTSLGRSSMFMGMEAILGKSIVMVMLSVVL